MAAYDAPPASRALYGHIPMAPYHEGSPVGAMSINMSNMPMQVPAMHHNPLPFPQILAAETLIMNPLKQIIPNPPAAAPVVNDRPTVTMPEEFYNALMTESDSTNSLDDMVSVCSQCNFRNYTMDIKWKNAKTKLKYIDQFMSHLCKQVNFNLIPSPSAPLVPGQPSLSQGVMCPPQTQPQSDVYNLKSNLSANAQEFRPIQTHKQASLQHEDQLHQQAHNVATMTAAGVVATNKDRYLGHNSSNNNNNSNSNIVNSDDSKVRGMSSNEPLDINDSGTLESGIDSGVHDSGVSDSGVTDPAVTDSAPDRFTPVADDACNACESDYLKNEKDGKKRAKKKRQKPKSQKSENGSMDNLCGDDVNDKNYEYASPPSSSAVTSDPHYNVVGRGNNTSGGNNNNNNNYNNSNNNAAAASGQLPMVPRRRSGSHGKGIQPPNRGFHMNDNAVGGGGGGGGGSRQHLPKPQRNATDNRRPASRNNNNYSNRDDPTDKRNGLERDRSMSERNERIPSAVRGSRNSSGPAAARRGNNVSDTIINCDATASPSSSAHRGPSVSRRSNNGSGSPYRFNSKKYNNNNGSIGGGGGGGSSSSSSSSSSSCNSSGVGSASKSSYSNVIREVDGNLFNAPDDYSLAHCVAEDLRMGAGIAVQFKKEFSGVGELLDQRKKVGQVAVLRKANRFIFYLITKQFSHGKPTLADMRRVLLELREECAKHDVRKLAIPQIGCGLDNLRWVDVRDLLNDVFSPTEIEIVVYNYKEEEESSELLPSSSHLKNTTAGSSLSSVPKPPLVKHRPHPLVNIEEETALVVFGTSTGFMDKTCQSVNSKHSFQKQYQEQCRKTPVGEVIEVKAPNPHYYVYVLLIRENETAPFSFKNLENCVVQLNAKLKKAKFRYVAFDAVEDSEDPAITEKIVNLFRNHIFHGIEIYICNYSKNNATTNNSSNVAAIADRDHSLLSSHPSSPQQQQQNYSNPPKFNSTRRA